MTLSRAFFGALLATAVAFVVFAGVRKLNTPVAESIGQRLLGNVFVSDQVSLAEVERVAHFGYKTLIDLRPDGEAAEQPSSAEIGAAAAAKGLKFAYVPTPHGDIPDQVVADLQRALDSADRPVILYCRSGKRASRAWALAEASRNGGASAAEIAAAVTAAGQSVDDLKDRIAARIAARTS